MDDADKERAEGVKPAEREQRLFNGARSGKRVRVVFLSGGVGMPMVVEMMIVLVNVGVLAGDVRMRGGEFFAEPLGDAGEVENAEKDEHEADGKLHGEAKARRDHEIEKDNGCAHDDDSDGVAEPPEGADEGGFGEGALAADDGGDGDDMVGIGSMAHAEEETDGENGKTAEHGGRILRRR